MNKDRANPGGRTAIRRLVSSGKSLKKSKAKAVQSRNQGFYTLKGSKCPRIKP